MKAKERTEKGRKKKKERAQHNQMNTRTNASMPDIAYSATE